MCVCVCVCVCVCPFVRMDVHATRAWRALYDQKYADARELLQHVMPGKREALVTRSHGDILETGCRNLVPLAARSLVRSDAEDG